jgi:hypothetical protein
MVPGYPASVRVGTGTQTTVQVRNPQGSSPAESWQGCYPDRTLKRGFLAVLEPDPSSKYSIPPALAPIKYFCSDVIVTWSICRLCIVSRLFTSWIKICDPIDICWVVEKLGQVSSENGGCAITTQRILVRSQIWKWEVMEQLKLNSLHIDHIMIRWKLKCLVCGGNTGPIAKSRFLSDKTRCESSVPVQTLTQNCSCGLEPLLTLP